MSTKEQPSMTHHAINAIQTQSNSAELFTETIPAARGHGCHKTTLRTFKQKSLLETNGYFIFLNRML